MKLDALMFLVGTLLGIVAFSETAPLVAHFWHEAGSYGRLMLPELFGISTGMIVFLVVVMALGAFRLAEWCEARFSGPDA